jgi:hypothetical protein
MTFSQILEMYGYAYCMYSNCWTPTYFIGENISNEAIDCCDCDADLLELILKNTPEEEQ